MTNHPFEYDLAISFAEPDRAVAEDLARLLSPQEVKVFSDAYSAANAQETAILDHFVNLIARKARYCAPLISKEYPLHAWTESERTRVRERALRDADEYILPILLDGTQITGLAEARGSRDLRQQTLEQVARELEGKIAEDRSRTGPPSPSHDLRSGNVPEQEN